MRFLQLRPNLLSVFKCINHCMIVSCSIFSYLLYYTSGNLSRNSLWIVILMSYLFLYSNWFLPFVFLLRSILLSDLCLFHFIPIQISVYEFCYLFVSWDDFFYLIKCCIAVMLSLQNLRQHKIYNMNLSG